MNKEFVPYEQALALKELGFDEPCFCIYNREKVLRFNNLNNPNDRNKGVKLTSNNGRYPAPTYQQAFRWFRENHNLDGSMSVDVWNKKTTSYRIIGGIKGVVEANSYGALYDIDSKDYDTYEEAELECIKKLIELVKPK